MQASPAHCLTQELLARKRAFGPVLYRRNATPPALIFASFLFLCSCRRMLPDGQRTAWCVRHRPCGAPIQEGVGGRGLRRISSCQTKASPFVAHVSFCFCWRHGCRCWSWPLPCSGTDRSQASSLSSLRAQYWKGPSLLLGSRLQIPNASGPRTRNNFNTPLMEGVYTAPRIANGIRAFDPERA